MSEHEYLVRVEFHVRSSGPRGAWAAGNHVVNQMHYEHTTDYTIRGAVVASVRHDTGHVGCDR